jgi:sugar phosphate isomerase/epimerase
VREGHVVNPRNVTDALPESVKICAEEGVSIGMVTLEWKATDPKARSTEAIFAACGGLDVKFVKLGYFPHKAGDYWKELDRVRGVLAELGRMAAKHGVVACYHTHSGSYYGSNAAGLMHLLKDQNPDEIGAYLDVGHLAINGEKIAMALDMAQGYVRLIGIKSPAWTPRKEGDHTVWDLSFVKLTEGMVDCRRLFQELKRVKFDGLLSFFGEHSLPASEIPHANHADIAYCRQILSELESGA